MKAMDAGLTRRSVLFGGVALASAAAAVQLQPRTRLSDQRLPVRLESQVPQAFGNWKLLPGVVPVLPNPELQASLDALYSQTLARAYVGPADEKVMLSIAYGSDQSSEATAVHRPEFCYAAQGFRVQVVDKTWLDLGSRRLQAQALLTSLGTRIEPVLYWITLDQQAMLPGISRKLGQLSLGLRGYIPDGMLVRVSSISAPDGIDDAFRVQRRFLADLFEVMPPPVRERYFGA